jgi:hypothetical protein
MLLNFSLASQLHQAKVTVNLLKIIIYYKNTPNQARKGNGAKVLFCAGLCLQTEAETF